MFSLNKDNSNSAEVYGPHVWISLHLLADSAPDILDYATKKAWLDNIKSYKYILPRNCVCAQNFAANLDNILVENNINTREDLKNIINDLHNAVNINLNKKYYSARESDELIKKMWSNKYMCFFIDFSKVFKVIIIAILITLVIVILFLSKTRNFAPH